MKEDYGYLIKENLGNNKFLVSKNSSDFFSYILNKNENNSYIGSIAYELCNIECDGLIKCKFYEDKNNYYFITDLYEPIKNNSLDDYFNRNYRYQSLLTLQNLIKLLDVFIKLESLGLDYFMSNKIYIKESNLYLDFLCNKFLNNDVYENNLEVFKAISKKYFSINTDIYKDFYEIKEYLLKYIKEVPKYYEINFSRNIIEKYINYIDEELLYYEALENLEDYINNYKPYFLLGIDKQNREEIKIALGEYVFCCSTKNNNYLYCFNIMFDNQTRLDEISKKGLYKSNINFVLSVNEDSSDYDTDDLDDLYLELQNHNSNSKINSSVKSIKMEENLLKAENKVIQSKKLTQIGVIDYISKNQVRFLIDDFDKHFKQNHTVIIKKLNNSKNDDNEIKGVVENL